MNGDSVTTRQLAVVILAAGKGKRMNNPEKAKVMFELDGKPMIDYVVKTARSLQPKKIIIVVGWQRESVVEHISSKFPGVEFVEQPEQLGTGHAVLQTKSQLDDFKGDVLVLSGDVPALKEQTAGALIGFHRMSEASATIFTAGLEDPSGYGRIVRNKDNSVKKIVEDKDASKTELAIKEINSGIYVFDKVQLFAALAKIKQNNAQGEYYLTDVFEIFWQYHWHVSAVKALDSFEVMGINTVEQLLEIQAKLAS